MILTNVTMTGADNSVEPEALLELSKKYPFVEWAILVSWRSTGTLRFPTHQWMNRFADLCAKATPKPSVSVHFCGRFVQGLLADWRLGLSALSENADLLTVADRVQLNTHAEPHTCNPDVMNRLLRAIPARKGSGWSNGSDKEVIFQYDGVGNKFYSFYWDYYKSVLYDMSHGAGILPEKWTIDETIDTPQRHGFAGGLGPDNVLEQLVKIDGVVPKYTKMWIDMETHIRSKSDTQFDLTKVEDVLQKCRSWF